MTCRLSSDPSQTKPSPCAACVRLIQHPLSGSYNMQCLCCCARLVVSTHPNRGAAAAMMVVIKRHIALWQSTFGLADVKACARLLLEKRP